MWIKPVERKPQRLKLCLLTALLILLLGCKNDTPPTRCPAWVKAIGDIKPFKEEHLFRPTKEKILAYREGYDKYCVTSVTKAWNQEVSQQ